MSDLLFIWFERFTAVTQVRMRRRSRRSVVTKLRYVIRQTKVHRKLGWRVFLGAGGFCVSSVWVRSYRTLWGSRPGPVGPFPPSACGLWSSCLPWSFCWQSDAKSVEATRLKPWTRTGTDLRAAWREEPCQSRCTRARFPNSLCNNGPCALHKHVHDYYLKENIVSAPLKCETDHRSIIRSDSWRKRHARLYPKQARAHNLTLF